MLWSCARDREYVTAVGVSKVFSFDLFLQTFWANRSMEHTGATIFRYHANSAPAMVTVNWAGPKNFVVVLTYSGTQR